MEHKYLDHQANAKKLSWILAIAASVAAIIGAFLIKDAHTLLTNILFVVSGLINLCLLSFIMHYLNHNNPQGISIKKEVGVLHLTALAIIFIVTLLVVWPLGAFSKAVLEGIVDGLLVALLIMIISSLLHKKLTVIAVIGGLVEGILVLCSQEYVANIIMMVVAIIALVVVIWQLVSSHNHHYFTAYYLVVSLIVVAFTVTQLINGLNEYLHMYLHLGILISPLALIVVFFAIIPLFEIKELTKNTKKTDQKDEEKDDDERSEWVTKEYASLSPAAILEAPVEALKGVSKQDARLLGDAFGIHKVIDLANNRYFEYAAKIVEESKK